MGPLGDHLKSLGGLLVPSGFPGHPQDSFFTNFLRVLINFYNGFGTCDCSVSGVCPGFWRGGTQACLLNICHAWPKAGPLGVRNVLPRPPAGSPKGSPPAWAGCIWRRSCAKDARLLRKRSWASCCPKSNQIDPRCQTNAKQFPKVHLQGSRHDPNNLQRNVVHRFSKT